MHEQYDFYTFDEVGDQGRRGPPNEEYDLYTFGELGRQDPSDE